MFDDVLAVNGAFYDAHERRDLNAMSEVWDHTDEVVCTHPGWLFLSTGDDVVGCHAVSDHPDNDREAELLPGRLRVDVELHQLHGSIGRQLSDYDEAGDDIARCNQDAVLRPIREQPREVVPPDGEALDGRRCRRGLTR